MKAFEVAGAVDEQGNLFLDKPVEGIASSRVRVIVLCPESADETEFDPDNPSVTEVAASLRRALHEAASGQRLPLSRMWEDVGE